MEAEILDSNGAETEPWRVREVLTWKHLVPKSLVPGTTYVVLAERWIHRGGRFAAL